MHDDLGKLMDKFARMRARQHSNRAKLFRVTQKVWEITNNPHVLAGVFNAAKAHSPALAKELIVAGAATDYTFPAGEFATEVTRQRAEAKAKAASAAAGQGANQQGRSQ